MIYKIIDYSSFDNYTVRSDTGNFSNIVDKMIRITAKVTESYAGDIFYEISLLNVVVKSKSHRRRILVFRERGVSGYWIEDNYVELCSETGIQYWLLDCSNEVVVFKRIHLMEVKNK